MLSSDAARACSISPSTCRLKVFSLILPGRIVVQPNSSAYAFDYDSRYSRGSRHQMELSKFRPLKPETGSGYPLMTTRICCDWCLSPKNRDYASPLPGKWPVRKRCRACGAIGYVALPSPSQLDDYYKQAWLAGDQGREASGNSDRLIARELLQTLDWRAGSGCTLDFGAGRGSLAVEISALGGEVVAFEPYGDPALHESGIRVVKSFPEFSPNEQFEWIISMEVIEHLMDPIATLTQLYSLLSQDGRLVLTTPNANGLVAKLSGDAWRETANPTHLNLFTMKALCMAASAAGFSRVERLHRPLSYGKKGLKKHALSLTQLLGIDGQLRVVLTK